MVGWFYLQRPSGQAVITGVFPSALLRLTSRSWRVGSSILLLVDFHRFGQKQHPSIPCVRVRMSEPSLPQTNCITLVVGPVPYCPVVFYTIDLAIFTQKKRAPQHDTPQYNPTSLRAPFTPGMELSARFLHRAREATRLGIGEAPRSTARTAPFIRCASLLG